MQNQLREAKPALTKQTFDAKTSRMPSFPPPPPVDDASMTDMGGKSNAFLTLVVVAIATMCTPASVASAADAPRWVLTGSAPQPSGTSAELLSVSCTSRLNCIAVGVENSLEFPDAFVGGLELPSGDIPLIERFNGNKWIAMATPPEDGALFGVSCTSSSFCIAVGYGVGSGANAIIDEFNGAAWSRQQAPLNSSLAINTNRLWSVSCAVDQSCVAVGSDLDDQSVNRETIETPTVDSYVMGKWVSASLPNVHPTDLYSVSCYRNQCLAVGSGPSLPNGPAALLFDGRKWSIAADPPDVFGSVSCASVGRCSVVPLQGNALAPSRRTQFVGGSWKVSPPQLPQLPMALSEIDCTDTSHCVTVGGSLPTSKMSSREMIVGTFRGRSAHLQLMRGSASGVGDVLNSVSCIATSECVAVGTSGFEGALNPIRSTPVVVRSVYGQK